MTKSSLPFLDLSVWDYLRGHSYLSRKRKLLYVATPKVASTALEWWFAALEGYSKTLSEITESAESDPDLVIHDGFHKVAPTVTGLTPDSLSVPITSPSYFRFALVRNPYKRIFSAWQTKLLLREPLQAGPYAECDFFRRPIESAADIALAFEGFLEHLASREAPNFWDVHWTPQVTLLRPDLIAYTSLARIENASQLELALARHLGSDVPHPFAGRRTNESLIPYLPEFISEHSAALIRALYSEDFESFGYDDRVPNVRIKFSSSELQVALRAVRLIRGRHKRLAEIRANASSRIADLSHEITSRDAELAELNERSLALGRQVGESNKVEAARRVEIAEYRRAMSEHEALIAALNQAGSDQSVRIAGLNEAISTAAITIADLNQAVSRRDAQIADLGGVVSERDAQIADLGGVVSERDAQIADLRGVVSERDGHIADLGQAVSRRDAQIANLRGVVSERNAQIADLRGVVSKRDAQIADLRGVVSERDGHIAGLGRAASERDVQIADLRAEVSERDGHIAGLGRAASKRDGQIAELNRVVLERDHQIGDLARVISGRDKQVASLNQSLTERDSQLAAILASRSWRLSAPLRFFGKLAIYAVNLWRKTERWFRCMLRITLAALARPLPLDHLGTYKTLRFLYRRLPIPLERKLPWAQQLLSDVPELQLMAFQVQAERVSAHSVRVTNSGTDADGLLIPPRKRMLVVEHRLPTPDKNASSVRLYSMLRLIAEANWEITFVSNSTSSEYHWVLSNINDELPRYEMSLSALGIKCLYGMDALIEHLKSDGGSYRLALLSFPEIMHMYAPLVRAYMPNAHLVYDTVDLHGVRFAREADAKLDNIALVEKAAFYKQMEWANFEIADTVIAVTNAERDEILKHVPQAQVQIIPTIHPIAARPSSIGMREGLLFIGHYLHSPNEDAISYFVNEILPLINQQLGEVPFYMLGSSMTESLRQLESRSVHIVGYVEDPTPWFDRARVFVAPLRYGAGMKGKVGQSLGLGLPVVTTSIGAEGMMLENGSTALIADNPIDFADAVIKLYKDTTLWTMLAENGQAHVARHFSDTTARGAIGRLLSIDQESYP